jgi:hypothetical protein
MAGAVFSPTGIGPKNVPTFDLVPVDVRLGLALDCFRVDKGLCCGYPEAILALTTAPVIHGPGDIVVGPSLLLRYNFGAPGRKLVPYIQGGGGIVYNDAYRDQSQRAIGDAVEFLLQAGAGVHYRLCPNWSLDAEFDYFHISNADLATRNAGANAIGGMVGVTYYFHGCRR